MNTIRRIVEFAKVKTFAFKCIAIGAALALVASACVIQLASTQLIGGRQTAQAATANRTLTVTLSAKRGRILDANGSVLAQSVERYTTSPIRRLHRSSSRLLAMTTPVITATKLTANPWVLPERRPWADCWPKSWI